MPQSPHPLRVFRVALATRTNGKGHEEDAALGSSSRRDTSQQKELRSSKMLADAPVAALAALQEGAPCPCVVCSNKL